MLPLLDRLMSTFTPSCHVSVLVTNAELGIYKSLQSLYMALSYCLLDLDLV